MKLLKRSWLFYLNFCLLQWFGIRLARVIGTVIVNGEEMPDGIPLGWKLIKWIIPMSGWDNDYKYFIKTKEGKYESPLDEPK